MAKRHPNNDPALRDLTPELRELVLQHAAWWDDWAAERDRADKPPEPVYHYTNLAGFRGIVEGQSFWLHSIFGMNDDAEMDYGAGIARDFLVRRNIAACMANDEMTKAFLAPQLAPGHLTRIKERFDFYSISFGERDDPGQWKTYGDKHRGVAIGLSPAVFANVNPRNPKREDRVYVAKVLYGPSACAERHRTAIDLTFDLLEIARQRGFVTTNAAGLAFTKAMATHMAVPLIWNSIITKSHDWEHEQELRMLAVNDLTRPHLPIHHRDDGGRTRSYVTIPMPLREPGMITEIVVGADADAGTEDAVANLLRSVGIGALRPVSRARTSRRP